MTSVQAGEVEAVHQVTTENVYRQQLVEVEGQTDILTMGIPFVCPYNVNSIMNPILVMCMGLGYLFNLYRGKPLVREGGVVIMTHPTPREFHPVHHPSYIDFFEQVLADTTDPHVMSKKYEERFAKDEWYRHLYRTSYAYHGVHPFYMWYWGAHGDAALRQGHHRRRRPADRAPARLHPGVDARRRVRDRHRRRRPLPHHHPPAHAADHGGRRQVSDVLTAAATSIALRRAARRRRRGRARRRPRRRPGRNIGFPYRAPTVPRGVEVPGRAAKLGADYDTEWARRPRPGCRAACRRGPLRLGVRGLADPEVLGIDRLADLPARRRRRAAAAGDLRPQPPQPPRHRADGRAPCRAVAHGSSSPPPPTTSSTSG